MQDAFDVGDRAQPAVEPAEGEGGDRGEHEADHERELGVLLRVRREQRAGCGRAGLTWRTPTIASCASSWLILLLSCAAWITEVPLGAFWARCALPPLVARAASAWRRSRWAASSRFSCRRAMSIAAQHVALVVGGPAFDVGRGDRVGEQRRAPRAVRLRR